MIMSKTTESIRVGWQRRLRPLLVLVLGYLTVVGVGCMNPSVPFDIAINLPSIGHYEDLEVDARRPTLVVLQHGLWRSAYSLWRLERALRDHGYEVLNPSYGSTRGMIEEHARSLGQSLDRYLAERAGPTPRLCFIGHSMGGLVIRSYLAQKGAHKADLCLFIATPQRGASLVDKRKDGLLFRLFMGSKSALQLSPGHDFFSGLPRLDCAEIGVILGSKGDASGWNEDIPGDDDGTVAVSEAQLPEQTDLCTLPLGHTRISCAAEAIAQVLHYLSKGEFRSR